jgi:hypothetical protein
VAHRARVDFSTDPKYFNPSRVIKEIIGVVTWFFRSCLAFQIIRLNPIVTNTSCIIQEVITPLRVVSLKLEPEEDFQQTQATSCFARAYAWRQTVEQTEWVYKNTRAHPTNGGGRVTVVIAPRDHPIMTIWVMNTRKTTNRIGLLRLHRADT